MTMLRPAYLLSLIAIASVTTARSQVNDKGTMHISLGVYGAGHATHYEQEFFGVKVYEDDDGAASVTFPLEFQYGFAKWFSLGLDLEPGLYLDSSDTQTNGLFLLGLQPRFYIINNENFTWLASLQFGSTGLKIHDEDLVSKTTSTYRGSHFGLGTAVGFYFSDHFGIMVHGRYIANNFELRDFERDGVEQDLDNIDATLTTRGFGLQVSGVFSF